MRPRAVVFGLGDYYRRLRAGIWAEFEVVGLIDVEDALRLSAEEQAVYRGLRSAKDIESATRGSDIALILTPNSVHDEGVIRALRAGAAVVVEKPLAVTAGGLARLSSALRDETTAVYCSDAYVDVRGLPLIWFAERILTSDYRSEWLTPMGTSLRLRSMGRIRRLHGRIFEDYPVRRNTWLASRREGGGVIADMMVHLFALTRALFPDDRFELTRVTTRFRVEQAPAGEFVERASEPDEAEAFAAVEGRLLRRGAEISFEVAKECDRNERWLTIEADGGIATQSFDSPQELVVETRARHMMTRLTGHHHRLTVTAFGEWWRRDRRRYGWGWGRWASERVIAARTADRRRGR